MQKIRKAVIPAAGFGTRFLPQTKAMPKEMLPIVDKPVIQYVIEEAVAAGIEDIVIVGSTQKGAIEDHFDVPNADLLNNLQAGGKTELIELVHKIADLANFIYIRQKGMYGNGTPVLCAEPVIEKEMFAVMWGDEFIYSDPPRLSQMVSVYEKYGGAVISAVRIPNKEDLKRYGMQMSSLLRAMCIKSNILLRNLSRIKLHPIWPRMARISCRQKSLTFCGSRNPVQVERFICRKLSLN